jgi:predicted ATPase
LFGDVHAGHRDLTPAARVRYGDREVTVRRIAITGGPGAGKTTLWRALVASHPERVVGVPEVATLLLSHVFPRVGCETERHAVQRAIFYVQRELETVHAGRAEPRQVLLCDRGTVDGGGYWPAGHEAFFSELATAWHDELARYDAVLFLETAAHGGHSIAEGNAVRDEDLAGAVAVDLRLRAVWSGHSRFVHVPHTAVFADKLVAAERAFSQLLSEV